MSRLGLAAAAALAVLCALSGLFAPASDAPGAAVTTVFSLDESLTKVENPRPDVKVNRRSAIWDHTTDPNGGPCCDGGKWLAGYSWVLPPELRTGESHTISLGIQVSEVDPEQEIYFQSSFLAPGSSEGLGVTYPEKSGDSKEFSFTLSEGYATADTLTITIRFVSSQVTYTYKRAPFTCPKAPSARASATARAAAVNEVRVTKVIPSVEVHKADWPEGAWCPVIKDMVLKQGDEISCDPDGEATLAFADNSTVVVRNTTQLKIASFFTEGGVVRTEILLKMGEVAAKVNKSEATKSDMRIKNPTGIAGVRGTTFDVFYDPGSKTSLTSVTEGVVRVDPTKAGLKTVDVRAGKEVEVGAKSMSKVVGIGKAGARKGNNRREALDRVLGVIAKGDDPCGSTTPRKGATAIKPDPKGWAVSVKLIGDHKGTSKWLVARKNVTPLNRLAKQVKKRCA